MTSNVSSSVLFWIFATTAIYVVCVLLNNYLSEKIKLPKITSLYVAAVVIVVLLIYTETPYTEYDKAGKIISYMLYPATVALALPLYKNRKAILRNLPEVATATVVSTLVSVSSIFVLAKCTGVDDILTRSLVSKCVTTPVAVEITKIIGGIEGIAVCMVCLTGVIGAFLGHSFLRLIGIKQDLSIGLAIGATSHVIGTTKCLEKSQKQAGAGALVLITTALFSAIFICISFFILQKIYA